MTYVSAAIYAFAWIKDDAMRIAASKGDSPRVIDRVHDRIAECWRKMDEQITPGRYILGDELSVLDLYVTVISRFGPWRSAFTRARRRWPRSSARSMRTRVSRNSGRRGSHFTRGGSGGRLFPPRVPSPYWANKTKTWRQAMKYAKTKEAVSKLTSAQYRVTQESHTDARHRGIS